VAVEKPALQEKSAVKNDLGNKIKRIHNSHHDSEKSYSLLFWNKNSWGARCEI